MLNGIVRVPHPVNEPVLSYAPGTPERESLKRRLAGMLNERIEIPVVVGGRRIETGRTLDQVCPHDHGHVLAVAHQAGGAEVEQAIAAAREAWRDWSEMPWEARAAVFLKAADLLAGLEAEYALRALFEAMPSLSLAPGFRPTPTGLITRAPRTLIVRPGG